MLPEPSPHRDGTLTCWFVPGPRWPRWWRGLLAAACSPAAGALTSAGGGIVAVGAENEYANVISQIGGKYVHVTAILNNPNTDPHTFESSPAVSQAVSAAQLVVQNGVGYDTS